MGHNMNLYKSKCRTLSLSYYNTTKMKGWGRMREAGGDGHVSLKLHHS